MTVPRLSRTGRGGHLQRSAPHRQSVSPEAFQHLLNLFGVHAFHVAELALLLHFVVECSLLLTVAVGHKWAQRKVVDEEHRDNTAHHRYDHPSISGRFLILLLLRMLCGLALKVSVHAAAAS